jgi:hypothetical protein
MAKNIVKKRYSFLRFRVVAPESSTKQSRYRYEGVLRASATAYLKKNHKGLAETRIDARMREIYVDGVRYLEFFLVLFDDKRTNVIVDVNY